MLQLYADGCSDTEVCRALKVTYNDFDKRYKNDHIFQQLVDFGRLTCKAWWLELGRKGASGKQPGFSYQPWYANMKNRFGWADKTESVNSDDKPLDQLSQDELVSKIANHKKRLAKLLNNSNILVSDLMVTDGSANN